MMRIKARHSTIIYTAADTDSFFETRPTLYIVHSSRASSHNSHPSEQLYRVLGFTICSAKSVKSQTKLKELKVNRL